MSFVVELRKGCRCVFFKVSVGEAISTPVQCTIYQGSFSISNNFYSLVNYWFSHSYSTNIRKCPEVFCCGIEALLILQQLYAIVWLIIDYCL